mgnify:CR=1 FL=1
MMERRLKPSAKVLSRVRVAEIRANPYQPRALFDEESIRALARSIEENGLLSPLLLRRSAGDGYTLIAGERRLRALRAGAQLGGRDCDGGGRGRHARAVAD